MKKLIPLQQINSYLGVLVENRTILHIYFYSFFIIARSFQKVYIFLTDPCIKKLFCTKKFLEAAVFVMIARFLPGIPPCPQARQSQFGI